MLSYAVDFSPSSLLRCEERLSIYVPMIYTALCVMFLMREETLRGQVGWGWALEMESLLDSKFCC
jgi:hypothetical protein